MGVPMTIHSWAWIQETMRTQLREAAQTATVSEGHGDITRAEFVEQAGMAYDEWVARFDLVKAHLRKLESDRLELRLAEEGAKAK